MHSEPPTLAQSLGTVASPVTGSGEGLVLGAEMGRAVPLPTQLLCVLVF